MANLEPGMYRLSVDVQNPEPDRRCKHDWRAWPVIPKHKLFFVGYSPEGGVYIQPRNGHARAAAHLSEGLFNLICPLLVRVSEEPTDWLAREGYESLSGEVLDKLAQTGHLSLEQVKSALADIIADATGRENAK